MFFNFCRLIIFLQFIMLCTVTETKNLIMFKVGSCTKLILYHDVYYVLSF